jgi:hypothetical protein
MPALRQRNCAPSRPATGHRQPSDRRLTSPSEDLRRVSGVLSSSPWRRCSPNGACRRAHLSTVHVQMYVWDFSSRRNGSGCFKCALLLSVTRMVPPTVVQPVRLMDYIYGCPVTCCVGLT